MEAKANCHGPAALPTGTEPSVSVELKDDWAQSRSGGFADRKQNAFRKLGLVPSSGERVDRALLT